MKIKVVREGQTGITTYGRMYIDGEYFCDTLEDIEREEKIKHMTAIPRGIYTVVMSFSNRFQKYMPELVNVPNYAGVRIHNGNDSTHSSGCILVGKRVNKDFINQSKSTFEKLLSRIKAVEKKEKIEIEIC